MAHSKLVALGDSVMKGIILDSEALSKGLYKYIVYDHNFVAECASFLGSECQNISRFGNTVSGGLKCLNRNIDKLCEGDTVALEFGGNDCNFNWAEVAAEPTTEHQPATTLSKFVELYTSLIELIRSKKATPILLSLPAIDASKFINYVSRGLDKAKIVQWLGDDIHFVSNWHQQYNIAVYQVALRNRVRVIDISSIFLTQHHLNDYFCDDGMHPNAEGHRLITQAILDEMQHD